MYRNELEANSNENLLTEREKEIVKLISQGKTNQQIGIELQISIHTVKAHIASILYKLEANGRTQAVIKAVNKKIINI